MTCIKESWTDHAAVIVASLNGTTASDREGSLLSVDAAMRRWAEMTKKLREKQGEISFIGNGASAGMASHYAADILKHGLVRTRVYTDMALLTATSNDISYEAAFAVPLEFCMRRGDMLVAISSSGASPNIIAAAKAAGKIGNIVTLSAFHENNPLRKMGDINFYVPVSKYGLAETCHAAILHYWTDLTVAGVRDQS